MSSEITVVREPGAEWASGYFAPTLVQARSYHIDTPQVAIKLDQNESPVDWPIEYKRRVCDALIERPWNRYPTPYPVQLAEMVARYAGVPSHENLILGPGSNYIITLVMDALCHRLKGDVVITRPSFPLYENHAAYSGIPYKTWELNGNLEYDLALIPDLRPGSVVLFASPNNPVGNSLSSKDLDTLLHRHPDSIFVADEAYFEFSDDPYTPLLSKHGNLLILRTFSKALGAAGVRLGYVMGAKTLLDQIRKLRLPYLINQFALVAASMVLESQEMGAFFEKTVEMIKTERDRVFNSVKALSAEGGFAVKPTQANFILLRWPNSDAAGRVYQGMISRGVLVRNVSGAPSMAGCLRVTISNQQENDHFLRALQASL